MIAYFSLMVSILRWEEQDFQSCRNDSSLCYRRVKVRHVDIIAGTAEFWICKRAFPDEVIWKL